MNFLQALQKKRKSTPIPTLWLFPIPPHHPNPLPSLRCNSNRLSTPLMTCNSSKAGGVGADDWKFENVTPMSPKNPWDFLEPGGGPPTFNTKNDAWKTILLPFGAERVVFRGYKYVSFRGRETVLYNHDSHDLADSIWNQDFRRFCAPFLHITYICPQPILSNWMFNPLRESRKYVV